MTKAGGRVKKLKHTFCMAPAMLIGHPPPCTSFLLWESVLFKWSLLYNSITSHFCLKGPAGNTTCIPNSARIMQMNSASFLWKVTHSLMNNLFFYIECHAMFICLHLVLRIMLLQEVQLLVYVLNSLGWLIIRFFQKSEPPHVNWCCILGANKGKNN